MARTSYVGGDVGIAPYENAESVCVIFTGGQSRPPLRPSTEGVHAILCHSHDQSADWSWESVTPVSRLPL